jgi:hypothetical protein
MAKSRRIKTNAEEAVKENFNMETEDPIQQDPVQEEMVEGIKEIEQEQPEQKALVMSINAITLSAMRTLQAKQKAKRTGLDEVIASETLGQFQEDFWKQISDLPWELILMDQDPFTISYRQVEGSQSPRPILHFEFLAPVEYSVLAIGEMITCLTVYHKHRRWVMDNYSWTAKNSEQMTDLLCRLRCIIEQLIQVNE